MLVTAWIALLRAVNVGGTGKLAMADLVRLCEQAGFSHPRTYLNSGNAVFLASGEEAPLRARLEQELEGFAGTRIGVVLRSADEVADIVARNPFPDEPGDRVTVFLTDEPLRPDPLAGAKGLANEQVRPGRRELYVFYPDGMGRSRLRLPGQELGTTRNMNTLAKLASAANREA